MRLVAIVLITLAAALAIPAQAQYKADSDMEIVREKLRTDKKLLVSKEMNLAEGEAKGFWPIYDAYQKDLVAVDARLKALIADYGTAYRAGAIPDATAKKLLDEFIAVEEAELRLKRDYRAKLEKVLPEAKVARYLQIENKIRAVIRYEIASNIPLVQ